jgi:hypothetical protein
MMLSLSESLSRLDVNSLRRAAGNRAGLFRMARGGALPV